MAKINVRELDPQRYSCIQTEQQELKKQYSSHITMARMCPYCQNKLEILCKGNHGAVYRGYSLYHKADRAHLRG